MTIGGQSCLTMSKVRQIVFGKRHVRAERAHQTTDSYVVLPTKPTGDNNEEHSDRFGVVDYPGDYEYVRTCSIVPVRLSIGWRFQRALWK